MSTDQSKSPDRQKNVSPKKVPGEKLRGAEKVARIPVKIEKTEKPLRKPEWIRTKLPVGGAVSKLKGVLREQSLHTVCEEAACPNLSECFSHGTATFMIMGDVCTRRCPFCDVGHGRPLPLDENEPKNLADTVRDMDLSYVVVTSVDRDDLRDGGATHFINCIAAIREESAKTKIEVLVPDFRGRMDIALDILSTQPPDVFNHNLETVPRLYREVRPGADYQVSLDLIKAFKRQFPDVPAKSGLMLGVGEKIDEVKQVLRDLREHNCDMLTLGQYLQPSLHHLSVKRYVTPDEFDELAKFAREIGFSNVASGPMVRSSYHADLQASGKVVS
ncbi:MAG: lipoyl synthase [Gammaproteobacteria bacterium]|nr:lipoyl synthase [Gammaproteobacteria bacterium]